MEKMTLKRYYDSLGKPQTELRETISEECGVTPTTVFRWLAGEIVPDKLKRAKIAEIINRYNPDINVADLFPTLTEEE